MSANDFAKAIATGNSDPFGVMQYLPADVRAQIAANPELFRRQMSSDPSWNSQYENAAFNGDPLGIVGKDRRDQILADKASLKGLTPLTGGLASNEGAWQEGYKKSFENATWDPRFGVMVPNSDLMQYYKEQGMSQDMMGLLAALAVGGGIAAPQAIGGAGGLQAAGTSTTLADMIASGTAFPAAGGAGAAAATGTTGLESLPNAGTWTQTAVPGGAAPLGAGAEVGSGVTTAGAGSGQLSLANLANAPTQLPAGTQAPAPITEATIPGAGAPAGAGVVQRVLQGLGSGLTMTDAISAVLGVGTSIYGAMANSDAIEQASNTQADASQRGLDEMRRQFDIGQANMQPWLESGKTALGQLGAMTAPGGELNKPFDMNQFYDDGGYRFRLGEGEQATNRAAAARGGFNSGRTLKELQRWSQGLASDEYSKAFDRFRSTNTDKFNRLASLSGTGQLTATQLNNTGANYGNNVNNAITSGANANAAATIAGANARTSGYTGAAGAIMGALNNINQQQFLRDIIAGR